MMSFLGKFQLCKLWYFYMDSTSIAGNCFRRLLLFFLFSDCYFLREVWQSHPGNLSLTRLFLQPGWMLRKLKSVVALLVLYFTSEISLVYSFKRENSNPITQESGSFWVHIKYWLYLRFIREELYIKSLCLSINNFVVNHLDSTLFEKLNIEWENLSMYLLQCPAHT